jgi:hypothetical protein
MLNRLRTLTFVGVLAFVLSLGFLPAAGAFTPRPFHVYGLVNPDGCTITWNVPTGEFPPNTLINASVSTTCSGSGSWIVTSQPSGTQVGSGSFTCPSGGCSDTSLFSMTFTPGQYQLTAQFNGQDFSFSFVVSNFSITPEFPIGAALAVLAPLAALAGYVKLRKPVP